MKNVFYLLVLFLITASCGREESFNEESFNFEDEFQRSVELSEYASYEQYKVGNIDGINYVLEDNDLIYDVNYVGNLKYKTESYEDYFLIINENDNSQYLKLFNLRLTNDYYEFDITNDKGILLKNVKYFPSEGPNYQQRGCPWCWVVTVVTVVVDTIVDANTDSDCATAIKQCTEAGGLPSTKIEEGLFGDTCTVDCKAKE